MTELRIPAKPQKWLWWGNAIIQLPLSTLCFWVAADAPDSGTGGRIFMGVLGLCLFALWIFSVRTVRRLSGAPMFVVLASGHIEVPSMWSRTSLTIPYSEIEKATLQEIDGGAVSFFQLLITYGVNFERKTAVIPQQLIGIDALEQVRSALESHGVNVG